MHQRAFSEPLVMRSLTSSSASLTARVTPSYFPTILANEEALSSSPPGLVARQTPAAVDNSPKAPYNLPVAARLRASRAVPLGNKLGSSFPDGPRVCVSKVERVLREMPSDEKRDSKPPFKQRSTNLALEYNLADKELRAGKGAKPYQAQERDKEGRLLALKTPEEIEEKHCEEKRGQSGDPLTILLDVASSKPDKAIQFLDVLLVAVQDDDCRQQALEALGKVAQASPDMFSECLPSLRAAAKEGDKDVRLLALKTLGEVEWKHYFGEVEPVPDLPSDIDDILDGACPFWSRKKVRDTHLLVLIPAKVNGQPFSLNLLRELIQHPNNDGHKTQYRYYNSRVQAQIGASSPTTSYWLLITRDVLPESASKTHTNQKKLVAAHAKHTGLLYEVPKALEAAAAIVTHHVRNGERLDSVSPWTYTRCQELIRSPFGEYPAVVVGSFESSGLFVINFHYDFHRNFGVAGCRKLF
jgi:hypothetical protein